MSWINIIKAKQTKSVNSTTRKRTPGRLLLGMAVMMAVQYAHATAFVDTFDTDIGSGVTSFSSTLEGVSFTYTFTTEGDGGDFAWESANGEGNSSSINSLSAATNLATTERITMARSDAADFTFTSIFIDNAGGETATIGGYRDGALVGSSQTVAQGGATTLNFGGLRVDEVRITGTDFFGTNFDSFTGDTEPPVDSDGALTAAGGVTEPVGLDTTVDSTAEAVNVFDFTLSDGGTSDGVPLDVSQVVINVSGTSSDAERAQVTWRLNGNDASNVTGTYDAGTNTITFSGLSISVADGASETYTVNAYYNDNAGLIEDRTLILSVDGDTDLTVGAGGTQMGATSAINNGTGTTIDVTAAQLAFTTQPASSVSGSALSTQPVVTAQDSFGNTDVDFTETITLTEASAGSLSNNTLSATSGVASFTGVTYTATADQESFTLTANDQDGVGSNLATVDANSVTSDVVATQLIFTTQPAPTTINSGTATNFTTVPVVSAQDANNVVDTGYGTDIALAEVNGAGSATMSATGDTDGNAATVSITPSSGMATFTDMQITYTASGSGSETFNLRASSGGLSTSDSTTINAVSAPVVTDGNISISGASGAGGAFKIGDTVTLTWNNTAGGDNNDGITGVTADFSDFGGGSNVAASESSGTWTATFTLTAGGIDATNRNVGVTATNSVGSTTTTDTTNATVDTTAPTATDASLSISGATGTGGAFIIGDTVTVTWDDTAAGDNNSDTISSTTVDFSQFGGGAAVAATNTSDTWTATYTLVSGGIDSTNLNVALTATDDAGNTTTVADTTNATVDNTAPSVNAGHIAINGASGAGGVYIVGDTITASWDNTAGGDNNSDTIADVTIDLSQFGGGANVAATNSSGIWEASHTLTTDGVEATNRNISITALDNAGNATTTTDDANASVDTQVPAAPGAAFDQASVTAANQTSLSLTLSGAETGTTADYTITSDGGGTAVTGSAAITSAGQTLSGIDVSGLGDGTLSLSLTLADDAGNSSPAATATIDKDALAPSVASVAATDGHYAQGDDIFVVVELDETDITVSGTNASLQIDIGPDTRTAGFVSEVNGILQFSYTVQADENTDANGVTVLASSIALNGDTIQDAGGNDADLTFNQVSNANAQVDTIVPAAPAVTSPAAAISVNTDDRDISGSHGENGLTVELFADDDQDGLADNNTVLASASVAGGAWTLTRTLAQNTDNHLVVIARDLAGNVSPAAVVPRITHDNVAPGAPQSLALAAESDTGESDQDGVTNLKTPIITGTAASGTRIDLSSDLDGDLGTANADGSDQWSITTTALSEGEHQLNARATDNAGNISSASSALVITVDSQGPVLGSIPDQTIPPGGTTDALEFGLADNLTAATDIALSTETSNPEVVPEANILLGGSEENRTIEVTGELPGSATITITAEDKAGNSASVEFVVGTNAPPSIDGTPPSNAVEGEAYEFVPTAEDPDGDALSFGASGLPAWLTFDSVTGVLSGIPGPADVGQHENIRLSVSDGIDSTELAPFSIQVSPGLDSDGDGVSDHQEELDGTDPEDPLDYLDGEPPVLTAPADLTLNAVALLSPVSLQQLLGLNDGAGEEQVQQALNQLASDAIDGQGCCNPQVTGMEGGRIRLAPGRHELIWRAEDRKGNHTETTQRVNVQPLVSLSKDQTTVPGARITFSILLNGPSPFESVTVPYAIDQSETTLDEADHDLSDGSVSFEQGQIRAQVEVNLDADSTNEGLLVVRLGETNAGAQTRHRVQMIQGNVAPRASLELRQKDRVALLIERDGGPVTATAQVTDPNRGDSHSYDWSASDNILMDTDGDFGDADFEFDPMSLDPGRYTLALRVTDSTGEMSSSHQHFVVTSQPPALSPDKDSNGDGIDDATSGAGDDNGNGIPNYRDTAPASNTLPEETNGSLAFMMECDSGVRCALGRFSLLGQSGGAHLDSEELESLDGLAPDSDFEPVGGTFDFEINDLPQPGQSVRIAIPLREAIPPEAVYRKYQSGTWTAFVENASNELHSAPGEPGYCPPPGNESWESGLVEGYHCVQLTLEDGGPNDADGTANGAVADPGGVSRALEEPDEPTEEPEPPGNGEEPADNEIPVKPRSSGGGTAGVIFWLLSACLWLNRRRTRSADAVRSDHHSLRKPDGA